jgi:hypothetical protein
VTFQKRKRIESISKIKGNIIRIKRKRKQIKGLEVKDH